VAAETPKIAVIHCSCASAKVQAGAIVFDKILEWLVVVVPVALGLILILVPTKREDPKRHMLAICIGCLPDSLWRTYIVAAVACEVDSQQGA